MLTLAFNAHAAPAFLLKDNTGKQHRLSDYKGKWVLVNYWATWCPPCLEEVPDLVSLYDQRKDKDLMVIGVAFEYKSAQEVDRFVDDMLMSYPIVLGDDKVTAQIGSAEVLPTTYLYDPQGRLVKVKRGIINKKYIEQYIEPCKIKAC
ncbi:MAG TPA: TlpA disulfide reductase family protein [Methylophilaceae bacterium]|nr:TlpA disulfide reductase family protein [Methylophilaceae bacterium]